MARRRRKAGGRKKPVPGWVWLSLGLVLGLALATAAWLAGLVQPAEEPVVRPQADARPPDTEPEREPEPVEPKKPDYSFYEALERDEARLPVRQQPPRSEGSEEPTYHYWLQLGAFRREADADALKARLALMGVESSILVSHRDGRRWHRVRVGPFTSKRARQAVLRKLQQAGFEPLLLQERLDGA